MLTCRGPLPAAALVRLLHAAGGLPLALPACLLEAALPALLAAPPAAAHNGSTSATSTSASTTSSMCSGRPAPAYATTRPAGAAHDQQPQGWPQEQQPAQGLAISMKEVATVLWLCARLRLRVAPPLVLAMLRTVHAHLAHLGPGDLARAVLGLAEVLQPVQPGSSSGGAGGGSSGESSSRSSSSMQLELHIFMLHEAVMAALTSVPAETLRRAARPGYAWGRRAAARPGGGTEGCRPGAGRGEDGIGVGVVSSERAALEGTLCAMSPDQLCSVLLAVALWQQQWQQRQQQQLVQQSPQAEWLDALLGLIQVLARAVCLRSGQGRV